MLSYIQYTTVVGVLRKCNFECCLKRCVDVARSTSQCIYIKFMEMTVGNKIVMFSDWDRFEERLVLCVVPIEPG